MRRSHGHLWALFNESGLVAAWQGARISSLNFSVELFETPSGHGLCVCTFPAMRALLTPPPATEGFSGLRPEVGKNSSENSFWPCQENRKNCFK